jgi:AcrR family transcriptional regulator
MRAPSYKERERQRREQEILDAAELLLIERGYAALTMDDLADAVGISKPTLYQHFKSKEDLAARVIVNALQMLEAHLQQPHGDSPLAHIVKTFRHLLEQRHASGGVLASLGPELVVKTIHTSPLLAEHKARIVKLLGELVDEAKARGEIVDSIPTSVIVRSMFCLQGALTDLEPDLEHSLIGVIHLFLYGIAPRADAGSEPTKERRNP